jgi:hypothetical protein
MSSHASLASHTRSSTPKYYVFHIDAGIIVLSGVSKTEATKFARQMDAGRKGKKRFAVAPVRGRK